MTKKLDKKSVIPIAVIAVGLLMALVYPIGVAGSSNDISYLSYMAMSVLLAGSSLLVGGFLGFLFGIPRTLQEDAGKNEDSDTPQLTYKVNTNLEQISDWLTKILVGVGLTQLSAIPEGVTSLQGFLSTSFGAENSIYAIVVFVYFVVSGFLLGYLSTRLTFATALAHADTEALAALDKKLASTAERIERSIAINEDKAQVDAHALMLIDGLLESPADKLLTEDQIKETKEALIEASTSVKRQAFLRAQQIRKSKWRNEEEREKIQKAIPIFEALIEDESERNTDKLYSELGYALKDQSVPNWLEAERALTEAIQVRGPWETEGSRMYEFNRARCRIMLDSAFIRGEAASKEVRDDIVSDLSIASSRKKLRHAMQNEDALVVIRKWIVFNGVKSSELDLYADQELIEELPWNLDIEP